MRFVLIAAAMLMGACATSTGCSSGKTRSDIPLHPSLTSEDHPSVRTDGPRKAGGTRADVDMAAFAAVHAKGAPVLDMRTPQEFAEGHVPGAVNIPLQTLDPADPRLAAYKDQPLYVICRSGARSAKAADQLAGAGFHAINVEGGTLAWQAAGHNVE